MSHDAHLWAYEEAQLSLNQQLLRHRRRCMQHLNNAANGIVFAVARSPQESKTKGAGAWMVHCITIVKPVRDFLTVVCGAVRINICDS